MIIAVGIIAFMAICALSLVGLGESHTRVSRILNELDDTREKEQPIGKQLPALPPQPLKIDVFSDPFSEVAFTRSLLALSKVGSPVPCDSPVLEHAESSSLVSVLRAR